MTAPSNANTSGLSVERRAELYDHMKLVAEANGFKSLTEAIAVAYRSREILSANDRYVHKVWTCECSSQLYNLTPTDAVCFVCSKPAKEWAND